MPDTASRRAAVLLWVAAALLALVATQRLADGLLQLVWVPRPPVDLAIRWRETQRWFAGLPVYNDQLAVYPPGSYPLLWPALGWVSLAQARWIWGVTSLAALGWLSCIAVRESGARTRPARVIIALLPFAIYPSRAVMVNGQLALHLLPAVLTGLLFLLRRPPSWRRDLGGVVLLLVALAKPTLTAPFMWIAITARSPLRPAALLGLGYIGLTVAGSFFQPGGPVGLVGQFAGGAVRDAARASAQSHANLHAWIDTLGIGWGYTAASLAALAALGWWTVFCARDVDPWIKLGVAALVARFWTFHYRYDDLLLIVPVVSFIRLVSRREPGAPVDRGAASVLALLAAILLIPARLFFPPFPWQTIEAIQTLVWLVALGYLVSRARRACSAPTAGTPL
jgi:Glycosyltransferase family 87